jgi:hypothetical protein
MTLQIKTFDELLEIINTHPDWRRKLVKALFPEIDLPKAIQELTEANRLLRAQLGDVEAKLAQIDARLGRVEEHLGRMEGRQERMEGRLINVERSVADLKGLGYENEVRAKADAIFGYFLRRGHEVRHEVSLQLDQAEEKGLISGDEYTQILATDLLWRGRIKSQENATTLVIEVSWFAEQNDLTRATTRSAILQRLGIATLPVVAAREWSMTMRQAAAQQGILVVEQFNVDKQSWQSTVTAANGG